MTALELLIIVFVVIAIINAVAGMAKREQQKQAASRRAVRKYAADIPGKAAASSEPRSKRVDRLSRETEWAGLRRQELREKPVDFEGDPGRVPAAQPPADMSSDAGATETIAGSLSAMLQHPDAFLTGFVLHEILQPPRSVRRF